MIKLMNSIRALVPKRSPEKVFFRLSLCNRKYSEGVYSLPERRTFQKSFEKKQQRQTRGYILLSIPITCFGLGVWQIQRKSWKENLISKLESRITQNPIPLPDDLSELEEMEYCPIHVKGQFLNNLEIHLGPRSLVPEKGTNSSQAQPDNMSGYLIITPFKLSDRDLTILVNRGWVPIKEIGSREIGQDKITGEVELTGLVRLSESPSFGMRNKPETNVWSYRDVNQMASFANTAPVFLDADTSTAKPGGPIAGQTRLSIYNQHSSYIFTWFALSALTAWYWYLKYMRKRAT